MKRALFVVLPERGHFHPMLGPAAALEALGFEVTFWSPLDVRAALNAAGFSRVVVPAGRGAPDPANRGEAFNALLADPARLRSWIRRMLVDLAGDDVAPLREAIRALKPHVVAIDPMAYAGAIAAELERVPWVGLSTSLNPVVPDAWDSELIRTTRGLEPARQALFARHGLSARFRVSDVLAPRGTVAFTTHALAGAAPPGVLLAGPSLPAHPRGEPVSELGFAAGRPLVYMSLGTQAYAQEAWYRKVIEATRGKEWALLASAGELALRLAEGAPENVGVVPFVPQLEVLARARLFVTHGGANSLMEGLAHGVPMLLSPICNDQVHNARFVERSRAGAVVDLSRVSPDALRAALSTWLEPGGPREQAAEVHASYRAADGARTAARFVAEQAA